MSTCHSCGQGTATAALQTAREHWQVGTESHSQESASCPLWGSKRSVIGVCSADRQRIPAMRQMTEQRGNACSEKETEFQHS